MARRQPVGDRGKLLELMCMKSRLNQIKNWNELAKASNYNAKGLARSCRISERQLQRFVQELTGQTLQVWLNELRLKRAPILFQEGQTVKEVACELGYKQRSHFSREFKRFYGVPPSYNLQGSENWTV